MNCKKKPDFYSLSSLKDAYSNGINFNFIFFSDEQQSNSIANGCLSFYFPIQFTDDEENQYTSVFQYIMSQKAILFKDEIIYKNIMKSTDHIQMKDFGRQIKNFVQDKWDENVDKIVYQGNLFKFSQNAKLLEFLLSFSHDSIFVYTGKGNEMYGIQLNSNDPDANNPCKWKGFNKLGFEITKVRDTLLSIQFNQHLPHIELNTYQITSENNYSLENLKQALSHGKHFEFMNFNHQTHEHLSLFYPIEFIDKHGVKYSSCYQFIMAQKALLFNDHNIYNKIMKSRDFHEMKKLGRQIQNFDTQIWDKISNELVYECNIYKICQDEKLYEFLLSFNSSTIFVNCDPNDQMYGILLEINDPKSSNPFEWKGNNILGFQITRVRDTLLKSTSNCRFISYAYDDFVSKKIFFSKNVESIDLISSGVNEVHLSDYPSLKRIRISKCRNLKSVNISGMPNLQVADLLNNKNLNSVSFKHCSKLITLDIGFCYVLTKITGIESINYLSAPSCNKLKSIPISKDLVYIDISDTSIDAIEILQHAKKLECLVCSNVTIKLSELTKNKSIKIFHLQSSELICNSISSSDTNLRLIIFDHSKCEGKTNLLDQFYISNNEKLRRNELIDFSPKYQQYQQMLYGPWGIPKIDLIPPVFINHPIIHPPKNIDKQRASDAILGSLFASAVMDMVGVGVEFINKDVARPLLLGNLNISWSHPRCNRHNERFVRGTPTDDTSQCILIMRSLVNTNINSYNSPTAIEFEGIKIDPCDFGRKLVEWMEHGHYEHKHTGGLGIGSTTLKVVKNKYFKTDPIRASKEIWIESGKKVAPNGSVMRIASSGCFAFWNEKAVIKIAEIYGEVSHFDPRCVFSSISAALLISRYIQWNSGLLENEPDIDQTLNDALKLVPDIDQYKSDVDFYIHCRNIDDLELSGDGKIGYCLKALGSGIWALRYCSSIEEGLVEVIRQGGDSDTNGAVVGALLGAKFGFQSIPKEFIELMFVGQWMYREITPYLQLMGIEVPPSPFL